MKLTGDLKKKVEKVNTKEEAKEIIKDAGMILTDDELEAVSGGADTGINTLEELKNRYPVSEEKGLCPVCKQRTELECTHTPWDIEGRRVDGYVCGYCDTEYVVIS